MNALMNLGADNEKTASTYLVEQINIFREMENNKTVLLHKSLLTKIEKEFEDEINQQLILPVNYTDAKGELRKCYHLDFEQSLQLLMSESKTVRKRCVEVIKGKTKLPSTLPEALRLYADEVEAHEKTKEITAKLLTNAKCYDVSVVAKECGFRSAQAFNDVLQDEGWVFKQNGFWKEYADKVWMKYFRHGSVVTPAGVRTILQITEKGRLFFVERYKS
jgi:AraC-like DNA-binding protein